MNFQRITQVYYLLLFSMPVRSYPTPPIHGIHEMFRDNYLFCTCVHIYIIGLSLFSMMMRLQVPVKERFGGNRMTFIVMHEKCTCIFVYICYSLALLQVLICEN